MYIHMHMCTYVYVNVNVCVYNHVYVNVYTILCTCIFIYIYICTYVYMYICICERPRAGSQMVRLRSAREGILCAANFIGEIIAFEFD